MMMRRPLRRSRAYVGVRRFLRRIHFVRALGLSGLLALALAAAASGRPTTSEPLRMTPLVIASPIKLRGVTIRAPRLVPMAPEKSAWKVGMGPAPVGHAVPVQLTAYCLKGTTRRGRYVRPGIVAADPKLFPLARYLEIYVGKKYFGRFLIDDTGGVIKGPIIDIWTPTCREAVLFGRRKGTAILVPRGADPAPTPDVANMMSVVRGRR
jgi:3D (Asp-Asp-Asp) domain-containing protein